MREEGPRGRVGGARVHALLFCLQGWAPRPGSAWCCPPARRPPRWSRSWRTCGGRPPRTPSSLPWPRKVGGARAGQGRERPGIPAARAGVGGKQTPAPAPNSRRGETVGLRAWTAARPSSSLSPPPFTCEAGRLVRAASATGARSQILPTTWSRKAGKLRTLSRCLIPPGDSGRVERV